MSEKYNPDELEIVEMPIVKRVRVTDVATAYVSSESRFVDVRYLVVYTNDGTKYLFAMTPEQATNLGRQCMDVPG